MLQSSLRSRPNTYKLPVSFRRSFFRLFDFLDWAGSGRPALKRSAPRACLGVQGLEDRATPALLLSLTGTTVTLDETAGLQNDDTSDTLPTAFSSRLTALGAPTTVLNQGVSIGNVISIGGVTGPFSLGCTDGNGGGLDGDTSGLFTTDGEEIFLFADAEDDNIALGKTGAGAIAFAVYIEETGSPVSGGAFWSILYEPLEHPDPDNPDDSIDLGDNLAVAVSEQINFAFAGAPSGSNLFMTFGDPNSTQIVVIGKNPLNQSNGGNITTKDVLNISQAGSTTSFGVNGNQINPVSPIAGGGHEGAIITYVTGTNTDFLVPNLDQNEADVEANIDFQDVVDATSASFTVNQTNPGVGPVTVKITAFSTAAEPGVNYVDGLTNDTQVDIFSASFVDFVVKSGKTQFTPAFTYNADGSLTVSGLSTGDEVLWTTSGAHNRVLIENISNDDGIRGNDNNTFDIGGFSIGASSGDSVVVGSAVLFEDDGPTIAVEDSSGTYGDGAQGTWTNDPGSDGFNALTLTLDSYSIGGVAGTGTVTLTQTGDFTFTGSIEDDFNDDGTSEVVDFTLTFNPDGTYDLVVTTPPTSISTFDTSQGSLKAGGPDAVQTLVFGGSESGTDDIVFFSVVPGADPNDILGLVVSGAADKTEEEVEASGSSALNAESQMNVSTSGIGVNNNNLNTGESFVVNPETLVDTVTVFIDNSVGGYSPATEQLYYTIYYADGSVGTPQLVTADMLDPVTSGVASGGKSFTIDGGSLQIDAVQLTMGLGTIKIPVIQFSVETVFNPQPISMSFTVSIADNDDDSDEDAFLIDLTP